MATRKLAAEKRPAKETAKPAKPAAAPKPAALEKDATAGRKSPAKPKKAVTVPPNAEPEAAPAAAPAAASAAVPKKAKPIRKADPGAGMDGRVQAVLGALREVTHRVCRRAVCMATFVDGDVRLLSRARRHARIDHERAALKRRTR